MNKCYYAFLVAVAANSVVCGEDRVTTVTVPDSEETVIAKADTTGKIHVLYHAGHQPMYVSTRDEGRTFSDPLPLVDSSAEHEGLEYHIWDLAVDTGGIVHVALGNNAWKLKRPKHEWGLFYTRLLPGAHSFEDLRNVNGKPSEGFSLAVGRNGKVTACWMADKLFANVSNNHGQTFAAAVEIDSDLDPCNCCTTSSVYAADGRLAVLYREETNNERDMYLALWDQETQEVSRTRVSTTPWKVDACPMSYYQIAQTRSGFTAVWPTKGRVHFARLNTSGRPVSPVEITTPGTTDTRTSMAAINADDGALVVWKKQGHLSWQFYDNAGQPTDLQGTGPSPGKGSAGVLSAKGQFILFL